MRCGGGTGFNPAFRFVLVFISASPFRRSSPGDRASVSSRVSALDTASLQICLRLHDFSYQTSQCSSYANRSTANEATRRLLEGAVPKRRWRLSTAPPEPTGCCRVLLTTNKLDSAGERNG